MPLVKEHGAVLEQLGNRKQSMEAVQESVLRLSSVAGGKMVRHKKKKRGGGG